VESLQEKAVAYMSFKWGESSLIDDRGRHFTNHTALSLRQLLKNTENAEILEIWDSETILRGQSQRWAYAIIRKCGGRA
jgi:hypothetical protein